MTIHPTYTDEQLAQAVTDGELRGYTATNWFGVTAFHGQHDEQRPHNFPAVRRVYDVTLDNNGGKQFRATIDTIRIVEKPAWKVMPSRYPGSPVYAIVDEHNNIAVDPFDGSYMVWCTRATAEYQLSRNGDRFRRSMEHSA